MYRIRTTGEVKSQNEIKKMFPNVSAPKEWNENVCDAYGVDPVLDSGPPQTTRYQVAAKNGAEQINGKWVWKWSVSEMGADAIAALDANQATAVRADRDRRLSECDWLVIKAYETNTNVPAEWELYRQALRDVPAQAGFPWDITWPTKP